MQNPDFDIWIKRDRLLCSNELNGRPRSRSSFNRRSHWRLSPVKKRPVNQQSPRRHDFDQFGDCIAVVGIGM